MFKSRSAHLFIIITVVTLGILFLCGLPTSANVPKVSAATLTYNITPLGTQAYSVNTAGKVVGYNGHAFLFTPTSPHGSSGKLTDLGTLGGTSSFAKGINAIGQVTGYSTLSGGTYRAFIYSNGKMTSIGTLGSTYSSAYSLNASGQVVGDSYTKANQEHAFLWTPTKPNGTSGSMKDLGTFGGTYSAARGINGLGQVVGYAYDKTGNFHAFLYRQGKLIDLGTLGGDWSDAQAINDNTQIVGEAYTPSNAGAHAFLWQNGTMRDLGVLPGGVYSIGYSISPSGQVIVGQSTVPSTNSFLNYHAFIYTGGHMSDLNQLIPAGTGWVLQTAIGVNAAGEIVGYGTFNGQSRGFLLTPK